MLLGQLGILQTQVGNFHIALTPLDEREKLPYVDNSAGLAVRLARAPALLHVGHMRHAAETAEQALAMTDVKQGAGPCEAHSKSGRNGHVERKSTRLKSSHANIP